MSALSKLFHAKKTKKIISKALMSRGKIIRRSGEQRKMKGARWDDEISPNIVLSVRQFSLPQFISKFCAANPCASFIVKFQDIIEEIMIAEIANHMIFYRFAENIFSISESFREKRMNAAQ